MDTIPEDFLGISDLRAKLNFDIANLENETRSLIDSLPKTEYLKKKFDALTTQVSELEKKQRTEKEERDLANAKEELSYTDNVDPQKLKDRIADHQRLLHDKRVLAAQVQQKLAAMLSPQAAFKRTMSMTFAILIALVICGFFLIANRDEQIRKAIFSGEAGIQFITLFSLVIAIILFGITGILEGKELAALLGGLSGYILGRSTPKS